MNNLVDLFFQLVKIDSPTGYEDGVAEFVVKFFEKRKIKAQADTFGNVIVRLDGKGEPLFLSAHMDTVEPGRSIKPMVKKGVIKSSGDTILGADNKVGLAAILQVTDELIKNEADHRPLDLVFTRNEESDTLGAVNLNYKLLRAKNGYIFDASRPVGTIITASPFYLRFDIEILGNSAHASKPDEANNSVLIFSDAMKNIKLGEIDSKTIANIGVITAGHVRNTIPGAMKLMGEVRSFREGRVEEVSRSIISEFGKSAEKYGSKIKTDVVLENPGYEFEENDSLIKHAEKSIKNTGSKVILERYYGCSDANIFNTNGLRVLNLGNGSRNAHTVNEEISVKDFEGFYKLILSLITS